MDNDNMFVISLGGSLIVPEEIDWEFIKKFKLLIETQLEKGKRFIIVTGGGKTARKYIEAASKIDDVEDWDKDWIGIHATRMNAHFIRTIFRKHAHPRINKNPFEEMPFEGSEKPVLVAAGYEPGNSTDYISVVLGNKKGIKKVANLSNIDFVYESDPKEDPNAKKIEEISWKDFREIVGDQWDPGANVPFDPVASKYAQENKMEVAVMNGKKLDNLEKYLNGESFEGTIIK